jgi:hypothetical protein
MRHYLNSLFCIGLIAGYLYLGYLSIDHPIILTIELYLGGFVLCILAGLAIAIE